jgi:tetratricopeptide (TPR) repeat protein
MNGLGVAYWQDKKLDRSILLFEEALQRREAQLGRGHPDTLQSLANLGVNYKDAGRLKEGLPLLEEAYRAAQKYPSLRWVGQSLLLGYAKAGENVKLAGLIQAQLAEARKTFPKDSLPLANQLGQNGLVFLQQKQWAEAEPLLRECLAIRTKTQPEDWTTYNTRSQLGGALLGQKKYVEAEPLLRAGYDGMKKQLARIPPRGKATVPDALERLVQLYEATDRPDEADKWRQEVKRMRAAPKKAGKQP